MNPELKRLVDYALANPDATVAKAADELDMSPTFVRTVRGTDAFRDLLAREKNKENLSPRAMMESAKEKAEIAAQSFYDELQYRIDTYPETFSITQLLQGVDIAQKANGKSQGQPPNPAAQTVNIQVTPLVLAESRKLMAAVNKSNSDQEAEVIEVLPVLESSKTEGVYEVQQSKVQNQ